MAGNLTPPTGRELGLQLAVEGEVYRRLFDVTLYVIQRMVDGSVGATGAIQTFGEALQAGLADRAKLLEIHQAAAAVARYNVLSAATGRLSAFRGLNFHNQYRTGANDNRLSGKLLPALEAPGVIAVGTEEGVQFINQAALTATARHWRRLQYGAGNAGGGGGLSVSLTFDARLIKNLALESKPRPAFGIPVGTWVKGEGGDQFYPRVTRKTRGGVTTHPDFRSEKRPEKGGFKITKGIEAYRFFDAGLFAMVSDPTDGLSAGYTRYFNESLNNAKTKLGQALAGAQSAVSSSRIPYSTFGRR